VCADHEYEEIITAIKNAAHTGRKGDGKIFVSGIDHVMSILTGATDQDAV